MEVADENPNVQKEPKPKVFFEKFGDSSLDFKLGIWTQLPIPINQSLLEAKFIMHPLKSLKRIILRFRPQRDVH